MALEDRLYKFLSSYKAMPDWVKIILASPSRMFPRYMLLGKYYKVFYEEAKMFEFAPKGKIQDYQLMKLQILLQHCYSTVPFYRDTWNEYGVNINNINSLDDFSNSIPYLTRSMVQNHPEQFISQKYKPSMRLKMNSGGSTGIPLTLYYLKGFTRAAEWAHMHLQWSRVGYTIGKPMATLRGDYMGKNRMFSFDPFRNTLMLSSYKLNKSNADFYLDLLVKYKIEYINAYPASLYNLVQLSKYKSRMIPSLKVVFLGSENIFEWQLQKFSEFFQIERIFYWYGHGEVCALGGGCEYSSDYHFFPTYSYVEFSSDMGKDSNTDSNQTVEIVGTSYVNPLMPLIRYKTQDYGIVENNECRCTRKHKKLSRVIGREQEIALGLNGEKITLTALIFGRHADYFHHIIKMQIVNYNYGKLRIKIIPKSTFDDSHKREIIDTLSVKQGMPFESEVEIVDHIESTARGKHKFLIQEIK